MANIEFLESSEIVTLSVNNLYIESLRQHFSTSSIDMEMG